jgi:hypothetical protein
VDNFRRALDSILQLILRIGDLIVAGILTIELWLRGQLEQFGLSPIIQTTILVVLAALLIVGSLRLFGGLIRIAVILVLLLIAIHILFPVFQP